MRGDSVNDPSSQLGAVVALQRADVAMYRAKQDGSGVQLYQENLADHSPRRLALAGNLRSAVDLGQLSVRYQPQARLTDGAVIGVEALTRWEHPVYGEVPPDEFICTAEQTGQIRELTRFVLDEALRQCALWNANGQQLRMSVNLSVRNLLEPDLLDYLQDRLTAYQVPSWLLTLELTESHVMADSSRTPQLLADLATLGSRLSVDDFGTGYSSLAYLRRLPLRELKIDKSFVRDIASNGNDAAIVEAIIQLAHALRIDVVAEGIEDAAAERLLRNLGCDYMQGYYLAQPMRAEQLTPWLAQHQADQRRPVLRAVPSPRAEGLTAVEFS
jgi:EAL domain-containing protein (putative c-di-GMP-specific phosphodiesterase class I)